MFGQSLFQSLLTRLDAEEAETPPLPDRQADFRPRGLKASFAADSGPAAAREAAAFAYAAMAEDAAEPAVEAEAGADPQPQGEVAGLDCGEAPVPAAEPDWLLRLSVAAVAEDLGLDPQTMQTLPETVLAEKRRVFARRYHPDQVAPAFREAATQRMKIANGLIDTALRHRRWQTAKAGKA